ncbi:MAG: DUF3592 domain-containing protein [Lutibacter sp.]|nr:DUF3592 domain-containing protein [Lutibacter sp.]
MESFSSLNQSQIAGIIAQLVAIPFIIIAAKKWWLANQSLNWPKVEGIVVKGLDFSTSGHLLFLYEYQISGITYQGKKPFFANSFKNLREKKSWKLIERYPEGMSVNVYYNSANPKISTLEIGRKDGVITVLIIMVLLFILGFISQHYPTLLYQFLNYFQT